MSVTLSLCDSVTLRDLKYIHTYLAQPCYVALGLALISGLLRISNKSFLTLDDQYCNPKQDLNLGLRVNVYLNLTHSSIQIFFAEIGQATNHLRDVILDAV